MNKAIAIIIGVLVFTFTYPRILISTLGEANPWTSYLYMYGFGLMVFAIGMYLIKKSKAYKPGRGHDDHWYRYLIIGFIFFATLHGLWVALALYTPYKGGM